MSTQLNLVRPDGQSLNALLFEPTVALPGQPGLVLIQEWWGVDAAIREVGQRLADAGYTVLLPDLYRGQLTANPDEAASLMNALDKRDAATQDVAAGVQWFKQQGRRVGVLGFCMGGALTLAAAAHLPQIDAAVCFYGIPGPDVAAVADIRVPLQGHFALQDGWCTPDAARGVQATLWQAGQHPEFHFYPAQHAFFNHRRPDVHDAAQAQLAWQRVQGFCAQHLVPPEPA